jgi:flavin-dependent thymidylate synthase
MKVILAGYNVDREVIDALKRHSPPREDVTPETLAASYARISRDPRPVDELRTAAREEVEKARRSNQTIIFKMGHHSVAEHAVFNFDIIGASRLAIEEIEKFRLCSFTEKSQRYITLGDDFILPEEIKRAGREEAFLRTIRAQNAFYHHLYEKLRPFFFDKHRDAARDARNQSVLEGWAKEDARYAVSLATEGQLGMTVNARNLEHMIRRFAARKLLEVRQLGTEIYALAKEVSPSIILLTEPSRFDAMTYGELRASADGLLWSKKNSLRVEEGGSEPVALVDYTPEGDDRVLAALLHTSSSLPYERCLAAIQRMKPEEKKEFIETSFRHMEFYDFPLREFEYASLTFSLVISASCYAQLKRHRMATLTCQDYDPGLGVAVPPSVEEAGAVRDFAEVMERTSDTYALLQRDVGEAAAYVLTNAHRRRVLLKVNARELYHISRLRQDPTAQWDIRQVVGRMAELARDVMPLVFLLLGGKEDYPALYRRIFGQDPGFFPPRSLK